MTLDDFLKDKAGCYALEEGFAVWEVKNQAFLHQLDMPDVHILTFVIRGRIDALIDNAKVSLFADSVTDCLQAKFFITDATENISVVFVFTTEIFLSNLIKNKPPFPVEYVMQVRQQPVLLLSHAQSVILRKRTDLLLEIFGYKDHFHQNEILKCALWMLFLEISNIFMHQNDDVTPTSEIDRKRVLFMKFVKMLPLHVKSERSIGFYADQMCISAQYLERVVKNISNQTAYQWIQRTLIGEINNRLKESLAPMQQIAEEFGFPRPGDFHQIL
jgi:AraC family transcriptional activator of pobA